MNFNILLTTLFINKEYKLTIQVNCQVRFSEVFVTKKFTQTLKIAPYKLQSIHNQKFFIQSGLDSRCLEDHHGSVLNQDRSVAELKLTRVKAIFVKLTTIIKTSIAKPSLTQALFKKEVKLT